MGVCVFVCLLFEGGCHTVLLLCLLLFGYSCLMIFFGGGFLMKGEGRRRSSDLGDWNLVSELWTRTCGSRRILLTVEVDR